MRGCQKGCLWCNISSATFYKWRSKYGGMDASLMARMKELEEENRRLKKTTDTLQAKRAAGGRGACGMYAEERIKNEIVQEALAGKL